MTESAVPSESAVYRRSTDVVARQVGAEWILVPIRQNVGNLDFVYTLDAVAARVWALIDGERTIDAIVTGICAEFDVDRGTATSDVSDLLSDLEKATLVVRER
jgi:hypothetical protein